MTLLDDLKHPFRYGNVISQIIVVNVACFLLVALFNLVVILSGYSRLETAMITGNVMRHFFLPIDPLDILYKPWTLITHMFLHAGIGHIFWNMLILYFFGRIFQEFTGSKRILAIFILGGLFGAGLAVLGLNLIPAFAEAKGGYMLGASAGVNALVMASATLMPEYTVYLLLIGPVRLKYIALFYLIIDFAGVASFINTGGHIAHIGGALFGFLFVISLRNGTDLSKGFNRVLRFIKSVVKVQRRERMKVVHGGARGVNDFDYNYSKVEKQKRIDSILDKINRSGYESLTREEKEFLYNSSRDV